MVVVPTFNELDNIERLLADILSQDEGIEALVVDDNSPDGTGEIVSRLVRENSRIHLIRRQGKLGLGSAYREGFKYALASGAEYIIEMDADFSHDPSVIPGFFKEISRYDLVIGSRYLNGVSVVNWPLRRLMLSCFANFYTRFITGLRISDCTGGFKCFRREVLEAIDLDGIKSDGYSFQIEVNYLCAEKGFRIGEIPIIFIDRHAGSSKMSKKIVFEAVFIVWKLKFWSLLDKLVH